MVALLAAPSAFAQDDDLLVPLGPSTGKSTAKPPKGKRRTGSATATSKPPKKGGKATAKRGAKGTQAKPPEATAAAPDDDLVVPLTAKTELLVKVGGGLKGARLIVDNKDMGTLPAASLEVEPGEHVVVVRRPGYSEFAKRVTVDAGRVNEVTATLEAVSAVVSVTVDVPGAAIRVDGEPAGNAPLTNLLLKPGSHDIEARRSGFEPEHNTLLVRAGKDYTVSLHLRPSENADNPVVASADRPTAAQLTPLEKPRPDAVTALTPESETTQEVQPSRPLYKRWYFWAGVGAVVAAGVVGTVAMTQSSPATPLTPTQVCGGPCDGTINSPTGSGAVRF